MAGRKDCTETGDLLYCDSANCKSGTNPADPKDPGQPNCTKPRPGGLPYSIGFDTPWTKPEITMLLNGKDTYDISILDGYNAPIEFKPVPQPGTSFASPPTDPKESLYWCGNPGGEVPLTNVPKCSWDINIPSSVPDYLFYRFIAGNQVALMVFERALLK